MTAYELADYVADNGYIGTGTTHEVANMLRQQADRIAELEKLVHQRFDDGKRLGIIETEDRFNRFLQTKPLSDDEILNVAFCCEVNTVAIENDWDGTVIDFARAILKKASEK